MQYRNGPTTVAFDLWVRKTFMPKNLEQFSDTETRQRLEHAIKRSFQMPSVPHKPLGKRKPRLSKGINRKSSSKTG
jgi:hypothetical protein